MEKKYALSFLFLFLLACYFNNSNSASFPVTVSDSQQQNWTFTSATSVTDSSGNTYTINLGSYIPNPQTDIVATLSPDVIPTLYTQDNDTPDIYTYNNNHYKKVTSLGVTISDSLSQQKKWTFTSETSVTDPKGNTHGINLWGNVPNPNTDKVICIIYNNSDGGFTTFYSLCRIDSQGTYTTPGTTGDKYKYLVHLCSDY